MHKDFEFDWNDGNTAKCAKHGLTRAEIEYAFSHGALYAADPTHSLAEQRFIALSKTAEGRPVFIAFCWRDGRVRPISARYMHRKEAQRYGIQTH
jgi:uncharacterized protein